MKKVVLGILAGCVLLAGCGDNGVSDHNEIYAEDETMIDVWSIENETEFVIALFSQICEKCDFGEEVDKLSEEEKVFYIVNSFEEAINGEGFDGYFFNSSGNFANETEGALRSIGAENMADICKKALDAYGGSLPEDWGERQEKMEEMESDEISDILSECDSEFYEYPDDLSTLLYEYVIKNKAKFE